METTLEWNVQESRVSVTADSVTLKGNLGVPEGAQGVVVFANGSGSRRDSSRNRFVAQVLRKARLATLLIDLLTLEEEAIDLRTRHHLHFDIGLLAARLVGATDWLLENPTTQNLRIGFFGTSTGSAAALVAAADRSDAVSAIVSCGGRPDLAGSALSRVRAPTLLIVGENEIPAIDMNQEALVHLRTEKQLESIPGSTHRFEEPGVLEEVTWLASQWFKRYLTAVDRQGSHQPSENEQSASG